jgi:hypothetical protein
MVKVNCSKNRFIYIVLIGSILFNSQVKSQKLFGIDFVNKWDKVDKQFEILKLNSKMKASIFLFANKNESIEDVYSYDIMFYNLNDPSDIIGNYKMVIDSISSQHGKQSEKIEINDYNFNQNSFLYKISNDEIKYYSKWNKSNKWNYTIETKIKSDGNIYITITDSSRYKSKSEIDKILLERERKEEALRELRGKNLINSLQKAGLAILNYTAFDNSEYTDGTGFRIKFFNPSKKTIKYINISFIGINTVNDKVLNKYGGSYINNVKCVGPIKQYDEAEYEWDYVWFTDIVETIKLVSIKVQYMDGTIKTITDFKNIIVKEDEQIYLLKLVSE